MTKFDELSNIVTKNKNKKDNDEAEDLIVSGLTGDNGNPCIEFATEEQDMNLIDQLYSGKRKISEGRGGTDWDQDWD